MSRIKANPFPFCPELCVSAYKIFALFLLGFLWLKTDSSLAGLLLLLSLSNLMLLRWRFSALCWTLLLDQIIAITVSFFWRNGAFALGLSSFEALVLGKPLLALPSLFFGFLYRRDPVFALLLIENLILGLSIWGWQRQQREMFFRLDTEGTKQYELEILKEDLLAANVQVAKMAELSERSRIAREIHDLAGHEIVAAYMSLQTAEQLWTSDPEQAGELFKAALQRLERGITQIRTAVHNLSPLAEYGLESLEKLCHNYTFCPVAFQVYGDSSKVALHLWGILEPCLKEALTNIIRHTKAQKVVVNLDITPRLVRLCVENDGVGENASSGEGLGLRNLRQRARAIGGNISTDTTKGFRLICVLPIT